MWCRITGGLGRAVDWFEEEKGRSYFSEWKRLLRMVGPARFVRFASAMYGERARSEPEEALQQAPVDLQDAFWSNAEHKSDPDAALQLIEDALQLRR